VHETPLGWLALVLCKFLIQEHAAGNSPTVLLQKQINHTAARSNLTVVGRPAWPRPTGLGFSPFWLNFVYVAPEFKYSPKLMELFNVSDNHKKIVLKS
jgi:hypothetical protein